MSPLLAVIRSNTFIYHRVRLLGSIALKESAVTSSPKASSEAVNQLKRVFEDYRKENYAQEIPSRYKKELICAVDRNNDGFFSVDDIDQLLINIGAKGRVSRDDLEYALGELGMKRTSPLSPNRQDVKSKTLHADRNIDRKIPVERLYALL